MTEWSDQELKHAWRYARRMDNLLKGEKGEDMTLGNGTREGFFQVNTGAGMFFARKAEISDVGVTLFGPKVIALQMVPNKDTKGVNCMSNVDWVLERLFPWRIIISLDVLDPERSDKHVKEIYTQLSGVVL